MKLELIQKLIARLEARVDQALKLANAADARYSQVITELYGLSVTRWTMTTQQNSHPLVNAALKAKIDADKAFQVAFRAVSEGKG